MTESDSLKRIQLLSTGDTRLWRNQVGEYWTGETQVTQLNGAPFVTIRNARRVRVGIPGPGGSDLIGLKTVSIKPEHIGQNLAVFVAVEVKSKRGRVTLEQQNFINLIRRMGGLAIEARSPDDISFVLGQL